VTEVRVISEQEGWLAVRAGNGPYLIGWTNLGLSKIDGPSAAPADTAPTTASGAALPPIAAPVSGAAAAADSQASGGVPARLVNEPGELRRVAAHSKVVFGDQVIGVFKAEGWARIIHTYGSGFADVFAAADDRVAIRGLMRTVDLLPVPIAPAPTVAPAQPETPPAQVWQPASPTVPPAVPATESVAPSLPVPVAPDAAPPMAPARLPAHAPVSAPASVAPPSPPAVAPVPQVAPAPLPPPPSGPQN
jgi:hypothetical protein